MLFPVAGLIQPTKLYYINLLVTNYASHNILLTASDNQPPGGFLVKAKSIAKIEKKLANPRPLTFSAEPGDASNKVLLINGQSKLGITPTEFEQQETSLVIKEAAPGGKRDICFYLSCLLLLLLLLLLSPLF